MKPRRLQLVLFMFAATGIVGESATVDDAAPDAPAVAPTGDEAKGSPPAPAPALPGEIVAALQEKKFAEARAALAGLREKATGDDEQAYLEFLSAVADRLEGRRDPGRETLRKAMTAHPQSVWIPKIRYELATLELAAGDPARAEELARATALPLLADERKDRLADVYKSFARGLLKPDDPVTPPDPQGARELLIQARLLAKGAAARADLTVEIAHASRLMGDHARAVQELESRLRDYPGVPGRSAVRLALGESLRDAGRMLEARLAWTDLARDVERMKPEERTPADEDSRALALAQIPATYGVPAPTDDPSLTLGVAALQRFLAAFPAHPRAVRAAFDVGASQHARGKSDAALAAFGRFLAGDGFKAESDEARKDLAELSMTATFLSGEILLGQGKFDEAVAAWEGYLAKFPNGPQSADAQRSILEARLRKADDEIRLGRHAEARALWAEFVAQNPLDARVPEILFQIGRSHLPEKQFDQAIAAWSTLLGKFPGVEPAAHAQFLTGTILEVEKGTLAEAVEAYKKIQIQPWAAQAAQRIAVMETKALTVVTPRAFRSGEAPFLKVATRNLERLTFTAYKLNAESYFRKKHGFENVEALDIGLVAPDAEWTEDVPGYARLKPVEVDYALKKLESPGVYVVKVTDQKTLQATTLVVASDLDAIVKTSRDQVLVFAQDMKTGKGRPNARVLVADAGQVVLEAATGADGVLLHDWSPPREGGRRLTYLVVDGPHVAGSNLGVQEGVSQGLAPRAYIYTDRTAYRPGQTAEIRGVVRETRDGQYANLPGAVYRFEAVDAAGRRLVSRDVTLSEFGTFHQSVAIDSAAPVGTYQVRVFQPGKSEFSGSFEVQSYQLQPIGLSFDLPRTVYYRGETIEADVLARFHYGAPASARPVEVALPDGRTIRGATDAEGKFHVSFPTEGYAEEQRLPLVATLPQDGVRAVAAVALAVKGFAIQVETTRDVFLSGETFDVKVGTSDAQGSPLAQELSAALVKIVDDHGRTVEREVERKPVSTDAAGRGVVAFRADDESGGRFLVRVAGTDRFGNAIVADRGVFISGKDDETTLRLIADRTRFKVGEPARLNLHSRGRAGTALLTWDADRILTYRIVTLADGDNAVAWDVDGPQFPNFTLTATRMWRDKLDQARLDVAVERDLRVTVAATKPQVGPGEPVEVEVTTVDQLGRPVAAELSLAVVDQALLRRFADARPIGGFFYDQTRVGAFAVSSTNTFRYAPATTPVARAIVDEAERAAATLANAASQVDMRSRLAEIAPPAAAPASRPARGQVADGAGMMGGGMAGMGGMMMGRAGQDQLRRKAGAAFDAAGMPGLETEALGEPSSFFSTGLAADKKELGDVALGFRDGRDAAPPRERTVETAYWNPAVVTGADGKARVTFPAPSSLSEYRITARGVTGSDTLVGEATSTVQVRKDFFVDLKVPPALTQGDRPRFVASVHHLGAAGAATLKLAVAAGGRSEVFPKTIEVEGDGVEEVFFDPIEVGEGPIRLTLSATLGERSDEVAAEIPVRPWGVQAFASASGSSGDGETVFVGLPQGRSYENPAMRIVVSPSLDRMIVALALGEGVRPLDASPSVDWRCFPPDTTADRAADLLAATSALQYLRKSRPGDSGEARRLVDRIQGLVSQLTASQREDGGWGWMAAAPDRPENNKQVSGSDRFTSASVFWALASAEELGLLPDPGVRDRAGAWLNSAITGTDPRDRDARAAILHALSVRKLAGFEAANSLNRERQNLSNGALAYLALTFANLGRPELAAEALAILGPRAKVETPAPGRRPRLSWEGSGQSAGLRSTPETTALVCLAYARTRPQAAELAQGIDWLEAHRFGLGWNPRKAKGPAVAALAAFHGKTPESGDRYKLTITVNDRKVSEIDVAGAVEPTEIAVPADAVNANDANRVGFAIEGQGTFHYAVSLTGFTREFGPDQARDGRPAWIERRVYWPAPPELDGKALPTGFGVAVNPSTFENVATRTTLGGKARVGLTVWRNIPGDTPEWERDFLIVEERLPAGTTLIEGSVVSSAASFTLADGVLTFYFPPDRNPGGIQYDVYGWLPGQYRTLPASVRSADEPGRFHVGEPGEFGVLSPGEPNPDKIRATPDELHARGKILFDAGKLADAGPPLEALINDWTLRDDVAKDVSRMLLLITVAHYDARKIVRYFEVVKERSPELILSFDQLQVIGRAYRDIDEPERAMIVWRGLIEAGYVEDARVGELLRQRGEPLEASAYLIDLWRRYPNTPSIETDFFGLSQVVADAATRAVDDPVLRRKLAAAGVTRSGLLLHAARMIQTFLAQSPTNPTADEASLALLGTLLELDDHAGVVKAAARYAAMYPKSPFLDGFQYSQALADFHLGRYDEAVTLAEAIAKATYKDASGVESPSPNKWQAIYILGQIFDARRMPARALEYYRQATDRFTDAADAVAYYTRKSLRVDEITVVRPAVEPAATPAAGTPRITLTYRNMAKVDVTVHPVDLMQLYLARRNLDAIAGVDLAGITPLFEQSVTLGSGDDYEDKTKVIDLPLTKHGAYLVMIRGGDLYASGVVLVSPLEVDVLEEAAPGRVRVVVRDATSKAPASRVQVKVVGAADPEFQSGETDLRGVYSAEGLHGAATVVVRKGTTEYAFHRGTTYLGTPPTPNAPAEVPPQPETKPGQAGDANQSLDANLRMLNRSNNLKQIERLQNRYQVVPPEQAPGAAAGEFR
ncbi:MG2 domain-containing protein [Planctomyces sp. SH-PL62]|uniref:MG2 domain-containing protein n=1 Tax=Planctomyces sp. SH-PL62 TaxID=1636152 RepID=UPI0012E8F0DE|nr:MG2 domain-containing protein [Planctomyces sp. SH-PL62]